ncbi:putative patatin [Dishui Lake phycodnavirus 4]|nr:putative patatin [Dishui Lake phycodnavirus 4]
MKYLVIGPAAMGYFAFLGFLKSKEKEIQEVEEISGSSAGAILALFLAVGLSIDEIISFSFELDVPEFVKYNIGCFFNKFGFVDVDPIRLKLIELCKGNPTFNELNKKIYISAFCLNTGKTEYFSADTHPTMHVIDAVCMSISIPFIFSAYKHNGFTYVDGGVVEMAPYFPFLHRKPYEVLCIYLKDYQHFQENIENPIQFLESLVKACLRNRINDIKGVEIDIGSDINIFDFSMSYEDKLKLFCRQYI